MKVNISTIVYYSNKVLIAKRSQSEDIFPGLWCIPGGAAEETEGMEFIENNLYREVFEEIGIKIKIDRYFSSNYSNGKLYLVFVSKYLNGKPRGLDNTEEVCWITKEEVENYKFTPNTADYLKDFFEMER